MLGPRQLGLLASVGRATVLARPRPRVVILSTGSELRDPGEELGHDSIYDGNSYMLAAAASRAGAVPHRVGIVPDDPASSSRRCTTSWPAPTSSSPPAASRRATSTS